MGIQNKLETFSDGCCLACCYCYLALAHIGLPITDEKIVNGLQIGYFEGLFGDDGTVLDGVKLLRKLTGDDIPVSDKIKDSDGISRALASGKYCLTLYSYHTGDDATKTGHWVVVKDKRIVFNSLDYSKNVATGIATVVRTVDI